jgi:hypothetical protein
MDPTMPSNGVEAVAVVQGYPSDALTEFVRAAEQRAAALRADIDDLRARQTRARAALGTHRQMHAMLTEAQREIARRRREAAEQVAGFQPSGTARGSGSGDDAPSRPIAAGQAVESPSPTAVSDAHPGLQWTP